MKFGTRSFIRMNAAAALAELYIYDAIGQGFFGGGVSAQQVAEALGEGAGAGELRVFINSPGGDVHEGIAIFNELKRFPGRKVVHVDGVAASIASLIAMAGDHIITAANATWMIHEPSGGCFGTVADMEKAVERTKLHRTMMVDTYEARTKQKRADLEGWLAAETWMDAKLAKERGFTDEIANQAQMAAYGPEIALLAKYRNTPERLRLAASAAQPQPQPKPQDGAPAPKETPKMDRNLLIALLSLTASATDDDIRAAIQRLSEAGRTHAALNEAQGKLLASTGKTSVDEALGVIAGWKAGSEQATKLAADLAEGRAKAEAAEREALIATAVTDGKLTPAMAEKWAKEQPVASLRAFLETAPKLVAEAKKEAAAPTPGATAAATPAAAAVFKALGVDPTPKEAGK